MSTAQELGDLVYATALGWVPSGGGIGEVERSGASVLVYGRQPGLLRPMFQTRTCVQADATAEGVRVIVVGGRPGIPQGHELFTVPLAGRTSQDVASETVQRISGYLAATTS